MTPIATVKTYRLSDGATFRVHYEAGETIPVTTTYTRNGKVEIAVIVTDSGDAQNCAR